MKLEIYSNTEPFFLEGGEKKVGILENTLSPSSDLKKGGYNAIGMHAWMHPQIHRQMWYSQTYDGRSQPLTTVLCKFNKYVKSVLQSKEINLMAKSFLISCVSVFTHQTPELLFDLVDYHLRTQHEKVQVSVKM